MASGTTTGADGVRVEATVMHPKRRAMLWINLLGGVAVLASYVWGFTSKPDAMSALWGGIPEWARALYTLNMLLAAAGYFLFTPYIFLRLCPDSTRVAGRFGFGLFNICYVVILVPSALWLPLTAQMVVQPSIALWWLIRLDLALVALGSLGLLFSVLDALIWPAYYPLPN
jgi:hypothetical protein